MRKALFTIALITSALTLPLTAYADPIDDFVLTGDGHTITYSVPATSSYPDFDLFNFFGEGGPATLDGVSGYTESSQYNLIGLNIPVTLILGVYDSASAPVLNLYLGGRSFFTATTVPASNPLPYLPEDIVATFTPGTYSFEGESFPDFEPLGVYYTLTITQEAGTATTPEPSNVALFSTGALGFIAFAARRKKIHPLFD
jgi:hypothetical protein